jgi:hypothetical protein
MATSTSTTSDNNNIPSNYHTVTICTDLPKVDKDYTTDEIKELPPTDYWIGKMDKEVDKECLKLQYIIANGPCE